MEIVAFIGNISATFQEHVIEQINPTPITTGVVGPGVQHYKPTTLLFVMTASSKKSYEDLTFTIVWTIDYTRPPQCALSSSLCEGAKGHSHHNHDVK